MNIVGKYNTVTRNAHAHNCFVPIRRSQVCQVGEAEYGRCMYMYMYHAVVESNVHAPNVLSCPDQIFGHFNWNS